MVYVIWNTQTGRPENTKIYRLERNAQRLCDKWNRNWSFTKFVVKPL